MESQFNLDLIPKQALKYFEDNKNVLVVEDDKFMGQMVVDILRDIGFNVTSAPNGWVAIEKLKAEPADFIMLDILLPELDGFEIYAKLQEDPKTAGIPVMMVSAWADEFNTEKASQLGIKHFLPKPFTEDELVYSILTLLIDSSREK